MNIASMSRVIRTDRRLMIFWAIAVPLLLLWGIFLYWMNTAHAIAPFLARVSNSIPLHTVVGDASRVAAALRADNHERQYVILVHDEDTLRPAGGKIVAVVLARVRDGNVVAYRGYDPRDFAPLTPKDGGFGATIGVPQGIDPLTMTESNWFADFPTNARIAARIFTAHDDAARPDAVIAVNAAAYDAVLSAVGPVRVGACDVGTGDTIVHRRCFSSYDHVPTDAPATFVGDATAALITRVAREASVWQRLAILRAGVAALHAKDVQIAPLTSELAIDAPLARHGWSGAVDRTWREDYVFVVDASRAPDGADVNVTRTIAYDADLSASIPRATVTITYAYDTAQSQQQSVADYVAFVRLFTPLTTWFTSVAPCEGPVHYGIKHGKRYAACMVRVPPGETTEVSFHYNLPIDTRNHYPYMLKVQRQSGVGDVPFTARIRTYGAEQAQVIATSLSRDIVIQPRMGR